MGRQSEAIVQHARNEREGTAITALSPTFPITAVITLGGVNNRPSSYSKRRRLLSAQPSIPDYS